jgi:hypothetical protein
VSFDNSRSTFKLGNDYIGPVMLQGRVQMDADWNEWLAEIVRRTQAGTLDILGRAAYPATTPHAFEITASSSGVTNTLMIGPGRMYVDGLLAENHGDPAALEWDPALGEMSDAPQPPLPSATTGAVDYTQQPYMPPPTALPPGNGPFLAYLDVWVRPVDYINDPNLIDAAVGVDSTGRLQTAWQVQLLDLGLAGSPGATCDSPINNWPPAPSSGLLSTGTTPNAPSGPCCLTSGAAYTGLENQFYRVEIHQPGTQEASAVPPATLAKGIATFKWSRDNGSVVTGVTNIANVTNSAGKTASQLTVQSLGRDQVLGFAPGDWIEILNDITEFKQTCGELHKIDTIDVAPKTITLADSVIDGTAFPTGPLDGSLHTRIRRWDQSGKVYEQDGTTAWWDIDAEGSADIPVPPSGTSLILENGITVSFDQGSATGAFNTGDFWTFAARTATGQVEQLDKAAPRGIHHHYARLAIVTFPSTATDCRTEWPPSTAQSDCGCCTYTVGDGVNTFGKYTSINDAINALPADTGGEVCILPGLYSENVFIEGCRDVVLRGCGWQTRIASPKAGAGAGSDSPPFAAVITVARSQHVQLLSFAVEAAQDQVGVLIDGTGKLSVPPAGGGGQEIDERAFLKNSRTLDVKVSDLTITASSVPAILADSVTLLQVESNRIAMENVASRWPAVWVSGTEIRVVHNWLGIQTTSSDIEWLPATVQKDIAGESQSSGTGISGVTRFAAMNPGGIQIAGTSTGGATRDVFVSENEIDIAGWNGITLGSLAVLDSKGNDTGTIVGTTVEVPGPCDTTITLQIPGTNPGQRGSRIVAAGPLIDIEISANRIRNTGACGIGPVGFFDPTVGPEIVAIQNLSITSNTISSSLSREITGLPQVFSGAFGAISIPFVEDLVIRDNAITDFGFQPGAPVCGIFVLYGQIIDISRNQVLETRDWDLSTQEQIVAGGIRGGIVVAIATPPSFTSSASLYGNANDLVGAYAAPSFVPGVPALRVGHNIVRVASGDALEALGFGPFSIVNNHLSTTGAAETLAATVLILNLGISVEFAALGKFGSFRNLPVGSDYQPRGSGTTSNGAVTFTDNMCQLEGRVTRPQAFSSVLILSLDDLIFGNNQCWLDAVPPPVTVAFDALLAAGFVQVTSNRFQEVLGSVVASGLTIGLLNVTGQNISTHCLYATGSLQPALLTKNLSLFPAEICARLAKDLNLQLNFTDS